MRFGGRLNTVELFAGTRSFSKAMERRGHETHTIELDTTHPDIDWYADVKEVTARDIVDRFGIPDVLWASPPCHGADGWYDPLGEALPAQLRL